MTFLLEEDNSEPVKWADVQKAEERGEYDDDGYDEDFDMNDIVNYLFFTCKPFNHANTY